MRNVKTANDALREINENFMKLDDVDIAKSNQIVDFLNNDVVSYFESYLFGIYQADFRVDPKC